MRFASFLSGEFTTMAVINPPERKLATPETLIVISGSIKLVKIKKAKNRGRPLFFLLSLQGSVS